MADRRITIPPEVVAEAEEMMKRFRAIEELPEDHRTRVIWEQQLGHTARSLSLFWRYLPDPLAKRGRRKGQRSRTTEEMLAEIDRLVTGDGLEPREAARRAVGSRGGADEASKYLARVWRDTRGKK